MKLVTLRPRIELAWSINTTWCPETYRGKDRAWGQCGVTVLYLIDRFDATAFSGTAVMPNGFETLHFWAQLNGVDVDFTARQFQIGTTIKTARVVKRAGVLQHNEWFEQRYKNYLKALGE